MFPRSGCMSVPGKQGRDDEVALTHMVRDLEVQMHRADIGGRKDMCAVVAVACRALRR
jgi:hypothetical protein